MRFRRLVQPELLIALLAVAARLIPGPRTIDDAYITFRYAQHLLQGDGLVHHPARPVLWADGPGGRQVRARAARHRLGARGGPGAYVGLLRHRRDGDQPVRRTD